MARRIPFIIILSESPGTAHPLLLQLAGASEQGRSYHVLLIAQEGVSLPERQLVQQYGWQRQPGSATDAQAALEANKHRSSYLLRTGEAIPADLLPEAPSAPMLTVVAVPPPPAPAPEASHLVRVPRGTPQPAPTPATVWETPAGKRAAFLVATSHRPLLLEACLRHLVTQAVPQGWQMEILVGGEVHDPGAQVCRTYQPQVRFIGLAHSRVTDKLNALALETQADLLLMADDDDLQPINRLKAAVQMFDQGCAWSASGLHRFVDLKTGQVARWTGKSQWGLVGTSVSITRELFLKAGGYPSVAAGKDGHLAYRVNQQPPPKFGDVGPLIGEGLICLQHGKNINTRPFPSVGEVTTKGKFEIRGEGSWTVAALPEPTRVTLSTLLNPNPQVATATSEEVVGLAPITCIGGGPGQQAFGLGLQTLGFQAVTAAQATGALQAGRKVLFHGWGAHYATLGKKYPGQVFTLWHSGWTGSDLLGEGFVLAEALRAAQQGHVTLLWLDDRDALPPGAHLIKPVWSPQDLAVQGSVPKVPRRVVVGLHSPYPRAAKNTLAAVQGCLGLGADLHLARSVLDGASGAAIQALLTNEQHTLHPFLSRADVTQLLRSAQVLVHPSVSDTWPYLVMEAVYAGTPVVLSEAVAWSKDLPTWAQDLCVARPATSSKEIQQKVAWLLDHPQDATKLVVAQREVLDRLAPHHKEVTKKVLHDLGFAVPSVKPSPIRTLGTTTRPKVLLLSDVRGWAFDVNLRDMAEYLKPQFQFDFWYVADNAPWPVASRDLVYYYPYLRWNVPVDYSRSLGSLRTRYFWPEAPNVPGPKEFDLVNQYRAFHVVTQANLDELAAQCPNVVYLTNPVNMRRFPQATPARKEVVCSWNGNAKHINAAGIDVKGFYSLVIPACEAAKVPLVFAEYHTKRVAPLEMPAFYQQANLAVSVSLYEGASNSVMEAMASGQALITTDVGNHREMRDSQLKHLGDTGIILVDRNLEAITEAIRSLKKDPRWVHEMGLLNRREIETRWSWAAWASRYADFLRMAL